MKVFGDGAATGVVSGSDKTTPASGALGVEVIKPTYEFVALANIGTGADTVRARFGETMLPRAVGGVFDAALVHFRFADRFPENVGAYIYGTGSTRTWNVLRVDTTSIDTSADPPVVTADSTHIPFSVPIVGIGFGIYRDFLNHSIGGTQISMRLDLGIAHRAIAGDLREDDNESLRVSNLGGPAADIWGWEGGMELKVNNLTAEFYYMNFFDDDDGNIRGAAKGNIVARFSVRADLFSRQEWVSR